jgi:malonyl-CoA/methylmalonyl-CoA synthetase
MAVQPPAIPATPWTPALLARARAHGNLIALVDRAGATAYAELLAGAQRLAAALLADRIDLAEARVMLLAPPTHAYVVGQWATWIAGGVTVPLSPAQPAAEWQYVAEDCQATLAIVAPEFEAAFAPVARALGLRTLAPVAPHDPFDDTASGFATPAWPTLTPDRRALILYTSGTTSRPKGVVLTHDNVEAEITILVDAWGWTAADCVLHVLPLNHTHGLINVLSCSLWSGAVCEMAPSFDPVGVWNRLASGDLTLFMAVPTIYRRLIAAWHDAPANAQRRWSVGAATLRLFVSGSAALPVSVLDEWRVLTGHTLLERYGMTEIGMALSNPLDGERRPGWVGTPLAGVEVRILDDEARDVPEGEAGELHVRGRGVFLEYWNRPDATAQSFREGRWFCTGDIAIVERGAYRLLGRRSVDIIKTGGEKVSALEIEDALREHPAIADCAVVGLPDPEWGELVAAALVLRPDAAVDAPAALDLPALRGWGRSRLAPAKLPRRLLVVDALPCNAMGKVSKLQVIQLFGA